MDTTPNNKGISIKFITNKKVLWPEDIAAKLFSQYQTMLASKLYSKDMDIVEILATTTPFKGVYTLEQIKSKIKNQKHSLSMKNLALQKLSQQNESSPPPTPTTSNGSMMTRRQNANNVIGANNNNNNNNTNTNTTNSSNTSINGDDEDEEEGDGDDGEEDSINKEDSDSYDDFSIPEDTTDIREVQDTRSFKKVKLNSLASLNEGYITTTTTPPLPQIEMISPNRNNNSNNNKNNNNNIYSFLQDQDQKQSNKQNNHSNFSNQNQQLQNLINTTTNENKKLKHSMEQLEFQLKMEKEQNLKLKNLVTKLNEEIQLEKEISKQINKSICSNLNIQNSRSISTNSVIFKKDSIDDSIVAIFPTFITTTNSNSSEITLTIDPNPPENYHKIIIKQQQPKQPPQIQTYLIKKLQDYYDPEPCLIGSTNSKGVYFRYKDKSLLKISIDNLRDLD
ncbi:hypothetical protein ACTFIV_008923 [Dictyostelium citrinum]